MSILIPSWLIGLTTTLKIKLSHWQYMKMDDANGHDAGCLIKKCLLEGSVFQFGSLQKRCLPRWWSVPAHSSIEAFSVVEKTSKRTVQTRPVESDELFTAPGLAGLNCDKSLRTALQKGHILTRQSRKHPWINDCLILVRGDPSAACSGSMSLLAGRLN